MSKIEDRIGEIEQVLTRRLNLDKPRFRLESAGAKVSGSIISSSFRGSPDDQRQQMIWDALEKEYGPESVHRVGSLLAFTPEEWDLGQDTGAE